MKKVLTLTVSLVLGMGLMGAVLAGTVLAAEGEGRHSGRVLIVAGGDLQVAAGEQADAVIVLGGTASVSGDVNALVIVDGSAIITGATIESLTIVNGTATLDSGTTVLSDINHVGSTVDVAAGADIRGPMRDLAGGIAGFGLFLGAAALLMWVGIGVATLLFALMLIGLATRQVRSATTLISREPGMTILVGLLAMVVTPIAAVLAFTTIVGIPTGMAILFFLWPATAFIGYVVAAIWLGEWLLGRRANAETAERPYAAATLGLVVAFVVGLVPLVTAILSVVGLGAVVLAAWRTLRSQSRPEPAAWVHRAPAV